MIDFSKYVYKNWRYNGYYIDFTGRKCIYFMDMSTGNVCGIIVDNNKIRSMSGGYNCSQLTAHFVKLMKNKAFL